MKASITLTFLLLLSVPGCGDNNAPSPAAVEPTSEYIGSEYEITMSGSYVVEGSGENEIRLPGQNQPKPTTKEEMVIYNCFLVRGALEAWAAEAGGRYPYWNDSVNDSGHTLIDFLPGGVYLKNPFNPARRVPVAIGCGSPGETAFLSHEMEGSGVPGYMIAGSGETGEVCRITKNWPGGNFLTLDSLTVVNCFTVQRAVERFAAENNGVYPSSNMDTTPLGNSVQDFLPGGNLLQNPYTSARSEPQWGVCAATPGQTGYTVWTSEDGVNVGYVITGWGRCDVIITIVKDGDPDEPDANHKDPIRPRKL